MVAVGKRGKLIPDVEKVCTKCHSSTTWRNRWLRIDNKVLCYKCHGRANSYKNVKYRTDENGKPKIKQCELLDYYRFRTGVTAAKKTSREWTLSLEEWKTIIEKGCYYCDISLTDIRGYSLDRIDNSAGYNLSNVLPCCGFCNGLKSNKLTVEETKHLIKCLKQLRGLNV